MGHYVGLHLWRHRPRAEYARYHGAGRAPHDDHDMRYRSTHAQRLERWLGVEQMTTLQQAMRDWYGPGGISIAGVPGPIQAWAGGDFTGPIAGGGFTSLSDLISESTGGKTRSYYWQK